MSESDYDKIASQRDLRGAVWGRSARTVLLRGVFSNECLYSPTMGVVEIVKRVNLSLVGHYNYYSVKFKSCSEFSPKLLMVPVEGLEPPRPKEQQILSL